MQRERFRIRVLGDEFQSSSGPRTGCNLTAMIDGALLQGFNPHPVRGPDATNTGHCPLCSRKFQSSSGPRTGCNESSRRLPRHKRCFNPHPVRGPDATNLRDSLRGLVDVSILIRSEDRMQQTGCTPDKCTEWFQSSSGPRTGCNCQGLRASAFGSLFQSSSGPRTGCNSPRRAPPAPTACFNPHPVRGPDATRVGHRGRG